MGKVELLTLALIGLVTVGLYNFGGKVPEVRTEGLFESWMDLHGKHYETEQEKVYRYGVWVQNFNFVQ